MCCRIGEQFLKIRHDPAAAIDIGQNRGRYGETCLQHLLGAGIVISDPFQKNLADHILAGSLSENLSGQRMRQMFFAEDFAGFKIISIGSVGSDDISDTGYGKDLLGHTCKGAACDRHHHHACLNCFLQSLPSGRCQNLVSCEQSPVKIDSDHPYCFIFQHILRFHNQY